MQTWLVHMRKPAAFFANLAARVFLLFSSLSAATHWWRWRIRHFCWTWLGTHPAVVVRLGHYLAVAAFGYCASASFGVLGLWQRGMLNKTRVLILTPVHWLLLSLAAWSAALELMRKPYFWKKTEHGVDKASRQESRIRALLELERYLTS